MKEMKKKISVKAIIKMDTIIPGQEKKFQLAVNNYYGS